MIGAEGAVNNVIDLTKACLVAVSRTVSPSLSSHSAFLETHLRCGALLDDFPTRAPAFARS